MSRVDSHGALMDRIYRNQRYLYDFTRKYYLFGRDRLIGQLHLQPGARIVEVGCGTARNLIQIAKKYPSAKLYGLDASAQMLATASQAVAQAGLSGRVKLVKAYAVLGDAAKRDAALKTARARYAGKPDVLDALKQAAATERMQ